MLCRPKKMSTQIKVEMYKDDNINSQMWVLLVEWIKIILKNSIDLDKQYFFINFPNLHYNITLNC